ncbi:ATPase [Shewanella mangrovi]|uniref:Cell division protein ZapE n=1 Tax=Shewanella mangrovi TaxID=1515746 RepID=A0A094JFN1_9GAMM|nr:cell division protein ZapE [Shewanella mangrovi]KFZ36829.1 ATPase [Shewanella mangrovi]
MAVTTPWQRYQQDLTREDFSFDSAQEQAVKALQRVFDELQQPPVTGLKRWFVKNPVPQVQGLYLWGGVGRGKTYLMDLFYESLPTDKKLRAHFHHFMLRIHRELNELKGIQDPLLVIAKRMAKQYQVICFDEFFVSDITDAMLLGTLFTALFSEGVALVATSNIIPDELYRNGLQRARFLPAIAQINNHCQVLNVDSGIDYRLRTLEQAEIYHFPLDETAQCNLARYFEQLTSGAEVVTAPLHIDGRDIKTVKYANGVLWLDFRAVCDGPRSQLDYMEIATAYHTVLLQGVEQMGAQQTGDDIARRFLALVDEFYERRVKLIISSAVALDEIYTEGLLSFEFRRCRSRLIEMQSREYLALEHLPNDGV